MGGANVPLYLAAGWYLLTMVGMTAAGLHARWVEARYTRSRESGHRP